MSTTTTAKRIDFSLLAFPVLSAKEAAGTWTIEADVPLATLDAAIAAAPAAIEPATLATNASTLRSRATTALTSLSTFLGTVAARRTAIAAARTTAQGKTSVAVGNVAAAQTEIRAIYGLLVQVATALDALNDQAELGSKIDGAEIRLILGRLEDVAGT